MNEISFESCPRCETKFEPGFFARTTGLSFAEPGKFENFGFVDEDVSGVGVLRKMLPSKGEWYRSYLCRSCKLYLVDYSQSFDREQVNEIAQTLV